MAVLELRVCDVFQQLQTHLYQGMFTNTTRPAPVFTRNHTLRLFSSISSQYLSSFFRNSYGIVSQDNASVKPIHHIAYLYFELVDWQQMLVRDTWPDGTNRSNDPTCMRQQVHSTETSGENWAALGAKPDCTGEFFFPPFFARSAFNSDLIRIFHPPASVVGHRPVQVIQLVCSPGKIHGSQSIVDSS